MSQGLRALVTGASGFIGSTLIGQLVEQGVQVYALGRASSSGQYLRDQPVTWVRADVTDPASVGQAMRDLASRLGETPRIDWVYHLAGVVAAPKRADFFRANADGALFFAQALLDAGIEVRQRFVFVSSLSAGGPSVSGQPLLEDQPAQPVSDYGRSKLAAEQALFTLKNRLPLAFVRPPMVYGPRDRGVFLMIRTVSHRVVPLLPSDGAVFKRFSVIHVSDLVRGLILVAQKSPSHESGRVFYLSEGRIYTDREILRIVSQALGVRPLSFPVPRWLLVFAAHLGGWLARLTGQASLLNPDKLNEMLPAAWICSNQRAEEELGFKPQIELSVGMPQTVRWYRENGWL